MQTKYASCAIQMRLKLFKGHSDISRLLPADVWPQVANPEPREKIFKLRRRLPRATSASCSNIRPYAPEQLPVYTSFTTPEGTCARAGN